MMLLGAGVGCAGTMISAVRRTSRPQLGAKVVVITGGSRGLGLALAEELGRQGAKLVLCARDGDELGRARDILVQQHSFDPRNIFIVDADLREPEAAERLIREATEYFGRIDILINNAGVITVGPIESQTVEDFRDVMLSNFFSGLHCSLAVLPQMLARKSGQIVNITSIGGKIAVPHLLPYSASKFAAVGLSEGLNAELRSKGIQVTTVCPGLMRTGSHLNALFKGEAESEYRWFSIGAALPFVSTSARSAARKIVRAMARGKREIAITPQAVIAARFGNLLPAVTSSALQLMNLALPSASSGATLKYRGSEVRQKEITPLTVLGSRAARRYNQTA